MPAKHHSNSELNSMWIKFKQNREAQTIPSFSEANALESQVCQHRNCLGQIKVSRSFNTLILQSKTVNYSVLANINPIHFKSYSKTLPNHARSHRSCLRPEKSTDRQGYLESGFQPGLWSWARAKRNNLWFVVTRVMGWRVFLIRTSQIERWSIEA